MGRKRLDPIANWTSKVDRSAGPDGCWLWMAGQDKDGYGKFAVGLGGKRQRHTRAHKFAYEAFVGPIPDGQVVCHRCDNPPCCNPAHLFLGTPRDNNDDKVAKNRHAKVWGRPLVRAQQTHCKRGHAFDEANTYVDSRGHRQCRTCGRMHSMATYHRKRQQANEKGSCA